MATHTTGDVTARDRGVARYTHRVSDETKHSSKTTELYALILAVAGILAACWWVGRDDPLAADPFTADQAWLYVAIVAGAYMISRGLAKSGSHREHWDDGER